MKHIYFFTARSVIFVMAFFLVGTIGGLISCDDSLETRQLTVRLGSGRLGSDSVSHTWEGQGRKRVFFISEGRVSSVGNTASQDNAQFTIDVSKTKVMPVLACEELAGIEITMSNCLLAQGAVYPFDVEDGILTLRSKHSAQVAQVLFYLYEKNVAIDIINIAKLYDTITKRSPDDMFDTTRFYDYVRRENLSYWSIAPKDRHAVTIFGVTQEWRSTSYWVNAIVPDSVLDATSNSVDIELYEGWWIFVSPQDSSHRLEIFVNSEGEYRVIR